MVGPADRSATGFETQDGVHCGRGSTPRPTALNARMLFMAYKDPEDHKAWCRNHYQQNKSYYYERNRRRRVEFARRIYEWKLNNPCVDCGGIFHPAAMDFDHRDPTTKAFNVGSLVTSSWSKIEAEIAKCELRCANCHRIKTHSGVGELADPSGSEPEDFAGSMPAS